MKLRLLAPGCWLLASFAFAQTPTLVSDTLRGGMTGPAVNGSMTISWPEFTYGLSTIAPSPAAGFTFPFVNGVINVSLVPTDHAAATVQYRVVTTIGGYGAISYWSVPTLPSSQCASSTHCTIAEVAGNAGSSGGGGISWHALTNAQWSGLTNSQWIAMGN
jgi:hypothetical protein